MAIVGIDGDLAPEPPMGEAEIRERKGEEHRGADADEGKRWR